MLPQGSNESPSGWVDTVIDFLVAIIGIITDAAQSQSAEETLQLEQEKHEEEKKQHHNELFMSAVEQLANDVDTIKLGGVHALLALAFNAPEQHVAITNLLSDFLHDEWLERVHDEREKWLSAKRERKEKLDWYDQHYSPPSYLRAALQAVSKLNGKIEGLNFDRCDLSGLLPGPEDEKKCALKDCSFQYAYLPKAYLRNAQLENAQLKDADLSDTQMQGIDFSLAKLQNAVLSGAQLKDANLFGAELKDADLCRANLQDAKLHGTQLKGTILSEAHLEGAKFRREGIGADAENLTIRQLTFTHMDENTVLPSYIKVDELNLARVAAGRKPYKPKATPSASAPPAETPPTPPGEPPEDQNGPSFTG
jgi:uncharacterized protein YjbI with pentapeptide repeats